MAEQAMAVVEQEQQEPTERTETCRRHGEFTSHRSFHGRGFLDRPVYRWSSCPKCKEEWEQAKADSQARVEREWQEKRIAACIEGAKIPLRFKGKTFDSFQAETDEQRMTLEACRRYVDEFKDNLQAGRCLVLCGTVGSGKTLLASAILYALASKGAKVLYITVAELLRMLRSSWGDRAKESEVEILDRLSRLDLLVLDEVGVQYGSEAEKVQLFDVINGRYNAVRPTIVISNLDIAGITAYLGERAVDRLCENGGRMLVFTGKSWRASQGR